MIDGYLQNLENSFLNSNNAIISLLNYIDELKMELNLMRGDITFLRLQVEELEKQKIFCNKCELFP